MTTPSQRDFLKGQLVSIQRLQQLAAGHPIMSFSLSQREKLLQQELEALPVGRKEARAVLFFSGAPVQGSIGIDASFASKVLEPFQSMVMADYANRRHGTVGKRGPRLGEAQSRLLLTNLPRGSFGLELSRAKSDDLIEDDQLAEVLVHITKLIESAAQTDEAFAQELGETPSRVIQNLRSFLEVMAVSKAGLRLETGDFHCSITPLEASEAFNRVDGTTTSEATIALQGILKGFLMEAWRFDFIDKANNYLSGKIDEGLTDDVIVEMNQKFFNKECLGTFLKTTVHFKNGDKKTTYKLKAVEVEQGS